MPPDDIVTRIDRGLAGIRARPEQKRRNAVEDLIQIRQWLDEGLQAEQYETFSALCDLDSQYHLLADPLATALAKSSKEGIKPYGGKIALDQLDQAENAVGRSAQELEWVIQLRPEARNDPGVEQSQAESRRISSRLHALRELQTLKDEVKLQWDRADRLERADPEAAVDACKEAFNKLDAAVRVTDAAWTTEERDEIRILRGEGKRRYDDVRNRHELPTTRQEGAELVLQILDFASRAAQDPATLVTYFTDESLQPDTVPMPVATALGIARRRLIATFWSAKTTAYIQDAERMLVQYHPREAMAALLQWQVLPGLDDDRVGVPWPANLKNRIADAEARIKPELEALERAERALYDARQELAKAQPNPLKANEYWTKARDAYPYLTDLTDVHAQILGRAQVEIDRLLQVIDGNLRNEDEWSLCDSRFRVLGNLLRLDDSLQAANEAKLAEPNGLYNLLRPLTLTSPDAPNAEQQLALFSELERRYPGYWNGWPGKRSRLTELAAHTSIKVIVKEARTLCQLQASVPKLEMLYQACCRLSANPPAGASAEDRNSLEETQSQVKAWLGFAQARDELAKSDLQPIGDDTGAEELLPVPDVVTAQQGFSDAQEDPQAKRAANDLKLGARLQQLHAYDMPVEQLLKRGETVLVGDDWQKMSEMLLDIKRYVTKPSRHRNQLLMLQRDTQRKLARVLDMEAGRLAAAAQADFYASLKTQELEELLRELNRLPQYTRVDEQAAQQAELALKVADAHRTTRAASERNASWQSACAVWEAARDLAERRRDEVVTAFCQRQIKVCEKRLALTRARASDNLKDAERLLGVLCSDPAFRDDEEVHFQHGKQCLELAQDALRRQQNGQALLEADDMLTRARDSLNRASAIAAAPGTPPGGLAAVRSTQYELEDWSRLAEGCRDLGSLSEAANQDLTYGTCRQLVGRYGEIETSLKSAEPQQLLGRYWTGVRASLRTKLDARGAASADVYDKVDALLATIMLTPSDAIARGKLVTLVNDALRQVKQQVDALAFDTTAENFLAALRARLGQTTLPDDSRIAQEQLQDVVQMIGRVQALKTVLDLVPEQVPAVANELGSLEDEESRLFDWKSQVETFIVTMSQAQRLIKDGLRDPVQLSIARYVLRLGGAGVPTAQQVPAAFKDRAHPTYRYWQEELAEAEKRRTEQERLLSQALYCLRYERVEKAEDLPIEAQDPAEAALLDEMRRDLQTPSHRRYPIERALQLMREMAYREPGDACALQRTMEYYDPDDDKRLYQSLAEIQAVIQEKIAQADVLRRWLQQFRIGTGLGTGPCPGIVQWSALKPKVAADADAGKLAPAWAACQGAMRGDQNGLYQGQWSLQKAIDTLSPEARKAELAANGLDANMPLSSLAGNLDLKRQEMFSQLSADLADCKKMAEHIRWRGEEFPKRWDRFMAEYSRIMDQRRVLSTSRVADDFRKAASAFAEICTNYRDFQQALYDVQESKGIHHEALRLR